MKLSSNTLSFPIGKKHIENKSETAIKISPILKPKKPIPENVLPKIR